MQVDDGSSMSDPKMPFRIIYHPAISPGPDGKTLAPPPINLGNNMVIAMRWMRRRLGMPLETPLPKPMFSRELLELEGEPDIGIKFVREMPKESTLHRLGITLPSIPMPRLLSGRDSTPPGLKPTTSRPLVREEPKPATGDGADTQVVVAQATSPGLTRSPLAFVDPDNPNATDMVVEMSEPSDADLIAVVAKTGVGEPSDADLMTAVRAGEAHEPSDADLMAAAKESGADIK